jgi:hypothetical protein
MFATIGTLAELESPSKAAETDLERVHAKRQRLESHMLPQWDRRLSLQIDACLMEEERLRTLSRGRR